MDEVQNPLLTLHWGKMSCLWWASFAEAWYSALLQDLCLWFLIWWKMFTIKYCGNWKRDYVSRNDERHHLRLHWRMACWSERFFICADHWDCIDVFQLFNRCLFYRCDTMAHVRYHRFCFWGLSFTKTVISTMVSGSLKQKEAGAGMSLLNFTSFLSEGTGISIAGGLLSIRLLDQRLLPVNADHSAYLYGNMLILFAGIIVMSWLVTVNVYKRSQRND